jgi:hypothetical protein
MPILRLFVELWHHPKLLFPLVAGILALTAWGWHMSVPQLTHSAVDTFRWAPRTWGYKIENQCTLYFDNGTEQPITVSIDDQGQFQVPSHQLIKLEEPAGKIAFAARRMAWPQVRGRARDGRPEWLRGKGDVRHGRSGAGAL